jgi:hypothetical protein
MSQKNNAEKAAENVYFAIYSKLFNQYRSDKWKEKIQNSIAPVLVSLINKVEEKYKGYIPAPKTNLGNRLRFLFTGKLK